MAFKKIILKISICFVVFLLILTFFSRTILDMGIPSVAIINSIQNGTIQYTTTLNGTIDYSEKSLAYSPVTGNIIILVKAGDKIEDGQPLFSVKSDILTQTEMLEDLNYAKESVTLRLQQTISDKNFANNKLQQLMYELNTVDPSENNGQTLQQAKERVDEQNRYVLSFDYQILQYEMELERNSEKIEKLLTAIETGESYVVTADLGENKGVITDIKFGINASDYIYKDNVVLEIGIVNDIYIAKIITSELNNNIKENSPARVALNKDIYSSVVKNITSENGMKTITVEFNSETNVAGEKTSVVLGEPPKLFHFVLPNAAVRQDENNKHYMFTVEARKSQFGYDYYVVKLMVEVQDQDEKNTAIGSWYGDIGIIVSSDIPIYEGDRVRIMNGSDFNAIR